MLLLTAVLGFLLAAAPAAAYQRRVIHAIRDGQCLYEIEVDDTSHTLRLRVGPEGRRCPIDKPAMIAVLRAALAKTDPAPSQGAAYTSLFIGRLIDYPWLSRYLAATAYRDPAWNPKRGRPRALDINRYVADILSGKETIGVMQAAFEASGYRVVCASVEKVLVGEWRDISEDSTAGKPAKVPFDAMVWFRLAKE